MVKGKSPDKKFLIIIAGPTAVGKTDVAIEVAQHYDTEIISADSRQFYSELTIGTAAPSDIQLNMVKHHFVGNLSLDEQYNVSQYEQDALKLLEVLFETKSVVVLTGGSGLYIKAIHDGIDELPDGDPDLRKTLLNKLEDDGLTALRQMLLKLDPEYARRVDPANPSRIIRALEVSMQTGMPYSSFLRHTPVKRNFSIIKIALNLPREELHSRINLRVDKMIEEGLINEARLYNQHRHLNALNTVGYKELFDFFDGKISLEQAVDKIKTNTRRYARRQITWFKKDKEYMWLPPDKERVINYLNENIKLSID